LLVSDWYASTVTVTRLSRTPKSMPTLYWSCVSHCRSGFAAAASGTSVTTSVPAPSPMNAVVSRASDWYSSIAWFPVFP
jgi:hypothetical protein